MNLYKYILLAVAVMMTAAANAADLYGERLPDGDGAVRISGELKQWHTVTLTLDGPYAHELDNDPNPFTDLRMDVLFVHESGTPKYRVPAYFAADGNAAESSAQSGTQWRAHLSPDKVGRWNWTIEFEGTPYDGATGFFAVAESDKSGRDLRGKGRLEYVGHRYLQFAGSKEWFLKAGADAPETLLAYSDFDGTTAYRGKNALKSWAPHVQDWVEGDPVWQGDKGKGLIGAVNYLSSTGCNAFSFLTYNAGGDDDNVWPHVLRADKLHFDCSKLDQWGILFEHATAKGMFLHFKLQETENDDLDGPGADQALDDGNLGPERKAYLREMIARFGHNLALNWNVGEENTQSFEQSSAMVRYIRETDPYGHSVVMHTYPDQHELRYNPYLGEKELLTGVSIQNNDISDSHSDAVKWVSLSEAAEHPWIVALDEAGNPGAGTPPDPDWPGMAEARRQAEEQMKVPSIDDIRAEVLWGTLLAGGTGVEYYFGYSLPENDLGAQNWRSRAKTWAYSYIALNFFRENKIPIDEMANADALVGNPEHRNDRYCFAEKGAVYVVYLRSAQPTSLDLSDVTGSYAVKWFNPRVGGALQDGSVKRVSGGEKVVLGAPPSDPQRDWIVLLRRGAE
ncbi:MAG: DUF5060 domain-containing protein [Pontiellaceae bacterium]|nr:DUF5060 domain-containing protein [Pontiellaceae bacterium]